jgi:hypothetical protein
MLVRAFHVDSSYICSSSSASNRLRMITAVTAAVVAAVPLVVARAV